MTDRRRLGVEGRKSIHTKGQRVKGGSNLVILRCTSSQTWRLIEDGGIGH